MSFLSALFGGGSSHTQRLMQISAEEQEKQESQAALAEQQKYDQQLSDNSSQLLAAQQQAATAEQEAEQEAYEASLTPADSENSQETAESKLRKLLGYRGYASTDLSGGGGLGAASVATKVLLGA